MSTDHTGGLRDVMRNGAFVRLWTIQAVTQVLQNMVNFALLLRVRDVVEIHNLPNANTAISLVILAFSLPAVLFGPLAGVIADRSNKRILMAILNVARAVAVVLFLTIQPGWHVETILIAYYVVTFFFGIAGQFFAPVLGATIPIVARREQLMSANALFNLTNTAAQLIGFAAAGPLVARVLGVDRLFMLAVVAYLISAALVFTLPRTPRPVIVEPEGETASPMQRLWTDMKEGLVYILQDPALMKSIGYLTLASTSFLTIATLGPDFVTSVIGLAKEDIGLVVAPAGIGIFVGVLTVPRVVRRVGRRWLISISMVLAGLMMALMAVTRNIMDWIVPGDSEVSTVAALVGLFAAILGICNAYILVPSQTMLQERSHEAIRARVYATFFTISNGVAFIPIFFAAAAADLFGVVNVLLVMAAIVGGLGLAQILHARQSRFSKWQRTRARHRLGPEALPKPKR